MKMNRTYNHPCMSLRNKELTLQARCFYQILSTNPYERPKSFKIEDLINYFKLFVDESEDEIEIFGYIDELIAADLIELE